MLGERLYKDNQERLKVEKYALFIIVTHALSSLAFCYIGYKIAECRQERNIQQEKDMQKKSTDKNRDLVLKVKGIATEYELSNEIENQTIGEISKKMCKMKAECKDKIRSEKEININIYSKIKEEYKERVWKKRNCF